MLVVLLPFFKSLDDFVELWDIYFIPFPSPLIFLESKKKSSISWPFPLYVKQLEFTCKCDKAEVFRQLGTSATTY